MKAAEYTAIIIQCSESTVCKWRKLFFLYGKVPERKQGNHQQTGVMWSSEELNKEAACSSELKLKRQPNMTISDFFGGVNTHCQ